MTNSPRPHFVLLSLVSLARCFIDITQSAEKLLKYKMLLTKCEISVRKYEQSDYDAVCRIFYNGIIGVWPSAYQGTLNFKSPTSTFLQITQLALVTSLSSSWLWLLVSELIIQSAVMTVYYVEVWAYTR